MPVAEGSAAFVAAASLAPVDSLVLIVGFGGSALLVPVVGGATAAEGGSEVPGAGGRALSPLAEGLRSMSLANSDCEGSESWGGLFGSAEAGCGGGG